jgi:response regulator of citrate/malate metabolism
MSHVPSMPLPRLRILLVEDHPFQLLATQCLLKSFGFEHVTLAENAEQAIRTMSSATTPFDLMLCDQCLPDLPGLELVEIASRRHFISGAILLSGLPATELSTLTTQALQRGLPLLGYLLKPLNKDELAALIAPISPL